MATDNTRPSQETRGFEAEDAQRSHTPDRAPTPEEEAAADKNPRNEKAAEAEQEYNKMAANAKGEGRV